MAQVKIENVSKRFGEVEAVKEFSLDIEDSEFIILVGPSGCGKTTLLRIVAGLETPSSGEIYIDGTPITHVAPKKRDIAMVFQNYALYPHKRVFDNLAFCLKLRKIPPAEIKDKVQKTAELLGIGDLLMRHPHQLSGGQRQRVAVGRAIIRNPKVFLFDEPLSNLDAKLRVGMRAELMDLHQRLKTTAIYVTHDQMEAMTMGTRLVIMKNGLIQQVGAPQEVYRRPANIFVAGFIGSPAMNFLDGQIMADGDQMHFKVPDLDFPIPRQKIKDPATYRHKPMVLGLRPEHIRAAAEGSTPGPDPTFAAKVRLVEPLGSEQLVHLQAGAFRLVARLDPLIPMRVGETATFRALMDLGHLFDKETGAAIT